MPRPSSQEPSTGKCSSSEGGNAGVLERVLRQLLAAIIERDGLAPFLAGLVSSRGDGLVISEGEDLTAARRDESSKLYELHVVPIGAQGVVQQLLEFRAPRSWEALFVATEGHEVSSEESNVYVTFVASRDGRRIALLASKGNDKPICETREVRGRIVDCVLRALELPSPPPTESVGLVSRRHRTWEELRQATAAGKFYVPDVHPDLAEWMDAGIFSRWCLESFDAHISPD